jgi:hypothetical protein
MWICSFSVVLLIQACATAWVFPNSLLSSGRRKLSVESAIKSTESAWKVNGDVLTIQMPDPGESTIEDTSLFDQLYSEDYNDASAAHAISKLSLLEISNSYQFSLAYLGDFVAKMGCPVPLDVDIKVGDMLTGEQVYTLLTALNSLDPAESYCGYESSPTLYELAESLGLSTMRIETLCLQYKEDIQFPYGGETTLHSSVIERIKRLVEMGETTSTEATPSSNKAMSSVIDL